MADNEKVSELLNLHKMLQEALKDEYDLTNKTLAVTKGLNSIQSKIVNEIKKEDKLKSESLKKSLELKKVQDQILSLVKAQQSNRAAHLNYEAEIVEHMKKAKKLAIEKDALDKSIASRAYMQALGLQALNKIGFEETIKFAQSLNEAFSTGGGFAVFGKLLLFAVDVFNKMDEAAAKFRMEMGITREYTKSIDENARDIAFNLAHVGVSAEIAYTATLGLSKAMFSTMTASKSLVTDVALISAQLGVSAEVSSEFMKNMGLVGRDTAASKADMTFFTAKLTEAAGVPLKDIMEDVSNATRESYQFISRSGLSLIKASVEAKRMGTSLKDAVKTSGALLNFTQNVKDEMEASVLLGKGLNLQKARELAYNRDIKGLNNEILKLMHDANFEQLDPFQQDAVARALGKSAGELAQMAQAERERAGWERSTDPVVQSQLAAYKEMMNATESIAKDLGQNARHQLMIKQNQAAIASITQSWQAILQRIGEGVLPFIEFTLRMIAIGVGWINTGIGKVNAAATSLNKTFGQFTKIVMGAVVAVGLLVGARGLGRLATWATGGLGKGIQNLFGGIAKGVGKFGGANVLKGAAGLFVVAAALIPFAFAMKMLEGVSWKTVGVMAVGMLVLVAAVAALGAIMMSGVGTVAILAGAAALLILGVAMIPFAAAAWIASKALQNLADVPLFKIALGLSALGIASTLIVAGGLALGMASPGIIAFSIALRLLAGPAERVGKAMVDLGAGLKSTVEAMAQLQNLSFVGTVLQIRNLSKAVVELSKAINDMPDIKVEKLKSLMLPSAGAAGAGEKKGESTGDILSAIKEGIDGLRNDMKNGSLTANVYIDSQKLDSLMGRRLAYTGQLT